MSAGEPYRYWCDVVRVIDGDTLVARIDLGFRTYAEHHIRLEGIDTPELRGDERPLGLAAKYAVEEWVWKHTHRLPEPGNPFILHSEKGGGFGRWAGTLWCPGCGGSLNEHLLGTGHARPWS